MIPFKTTQSALRELSHDSIATLIGATHDITLVMNRDGTIVDVAYGGDRPLANIADDWVGKPWIETVSDDSRNKVERLLEAADGDASSRRWRQVNHPTGGQLDIPILYLAIAVGADDLIIAIGKDLRTISDMQQQLLDMQHSIESEYMRLQQAEMRYRVLFQTTGEAIAIVDPANGKIVEANPSAATMLSEKATKLVGRSFHRNFSEANHTEIDEVFATVKATGKEGRLLVKLAQEDRDVWIAAVQLRRDNSRLYMVRLLSDDSARAGRLQSNHDQLLLDLIGDTPDGVVITDHSGQILAANHAFLELCQVASEFQLQNQPLDQWVGRPGVDVNVLRKNLMQRGQIRQFFTILNVEYGAPIDIELSAVALGDENKPHYGYVIRRVVRAKDSAGLLDDSQTLPESVEKMTELVGRVPLKELIRETTDIIEKMCIEAALKITGDNRASAADILGLSRQSLYVKLRRHGLTGDDSAED
ncbi:MAG: transcriptional regulator PpsR [Pseudomonadota bacterium]